MNRIKRARGTNSVMTGVSGSFCHFSDKRYGHCRGRLFLFCTFDFICILCDYQRIQRCDSGNVPLSEKRKSWKPVIQYDLSCIHITGIFRTAWSNCRNLSVYVCKKRIFDQVPSHLHRDTFLITIYRSRFVWIPGIPCVFWTWKKSSCRSAFHFHTGNSSYYNDDGGCNQWTAR